MSLIMFVGIAFLCVYFLNTKRPEITSGKKSDLKWDEFITDLQRSDDEQKKIENRRWERLIKKYPEFKWRCKNQKKAISFVEFDVRKLLWGMDDLEVDKKEKFKWNYIFCEL